MKKPFNNPFGSLEQLRSQVPEGEKREPTAEGRKPAGPARAVIRLERKGRSGKEVTRVEQLGLPPKALEQYCRELKQALGCGGVVEEDTLVLQGDQRERLPALLTRKGVKRVSVS